MKKQLQAAIGLALIASNSAVNAQVWVTPINGGTATFDDWGYVGPNGRTAVEFEAINGFGGPLEGNSLDPAGGVGQIQHVVTTGPDGITPDLPYTVLEDLGGPNLYFDANMDSQTNFYQWGYTTVAGSTFNNMQIDYDGDYFIPREDMKFMYYRSFEYTNMNPTGPLAGLAPADGTYQTNIQFQPYAVSDAKGWCGSVMVSNPAALEAMSGQVTFDFAFEAFFGNKNNPNPGVPGTGSLQIVPNFQMRSYGTLTIDVTLADGTNIAFTADAVVNNTNPALGAVNPLTGNKEVGGTGVDENYLNTVSFMGGGSVPSSLFVRVADTTTYDAVGFSVKFQENILEILDGANITAVYNADGTFSHAVDSTTGVTLPNVVLHTNSFAGYPFLLRADGVRVINGFDFNVYPDLSLVPASSFDADGKLINLDGNFIRDLSRTDVNPIDPDGDGLVDWADNCRDIANVDQQDTDGDNYGNACDADFNNDGAVNSLDIGLLKQMFLDTGDSQADLNSDQIVNSLDLGLFKARFLLPVGQSGTVQ